MRWEAAGGSSADTGGEVEEQSPHDAEDRDEVFATMERQHQETERLSRQLAAMERQHRAVAQATQELALEAAESPDTPSSESEEDAFD